MFSCPILRATKGGLAEIIVDRMFIRLVTHFKGIGASSVPKVEIRSRHETKWLSLGRSLRVMPRSPVAYCLV